MNHLGEIYGLFTALFWMITAISFEIATKRFGSLSVNFVRLLLAAVILSFYTWITRGKFLPIDADAHTIFWLVVSSIIGFIIGDYLLFRAFSIIGARVSQVMMALSPAIAALFSWIIIGELMTKLQFLGMIVTTTGIIMVVVNKNGDKKAKFKNKFKFNYPIVGLLFALGGALGQGIGLVISKYGMGDYNAFAASQIRVFTGVIGFFIIILVQNKWHLIKKTVKTENRKESIALLIGTIFGPFLGVSFSLLSVQHTSPGVAQTLMSIVPIIIIPFSHIILKEKIKIQEIIGAFVAFLGIALFFL